MRQPRSALYAFSRSIGERAITTSDSFWPMSAALPSTGPSSAVHIGHGRARCGPNMKLYAANVSWSPNSPAKSVSRPSSPSKR